MELEIGDEMDAIDDSETSSALVVDLSSSEPEKSKEKRKKNKERKSKALLLSSTSESKKRGRPKGIIAVGDDFTHHLLTVNPGEDLMKVMKEFNGHYKHRNIYIMSASGTASKVVLDGSPYPVQYEGRLKLLSLSVERTLSFGVNDDSHETLLASLSTKNGTVVGGTLIGQLIAASSIHIIVGTSKRTVLEAFEETIDGFTHHLLTVNPGEDLVKVMKKFNCHYKDRNVCIISASGTASKVELDSSPYPLQFEGQFQLLSLSQGHTFSRGNGDSQDSNENTLNASLSTLNGTVIGGTLLGFIAASPIQILAATFKKIISGESPTANQNINLASEDVSVVLENVFANPNISSASKYVVAGKNDLQLGTGANNVDIDEYGDVIN